MILWNVFLFAVCSLLCATAESLVPLLVYRIGQGVFGAPLVPLGQAIIIATYPPERRAWAQGMFGMSVVFGPAIAPALGGFLAEEYNWRWVFLLIVPLCVAAFALAFLFIRDNTRGERTRLDWTGFLAFSIAITCAQFIIDRGEREGWFESLQILAFAGTLVASFVGVRRPYRDGRRNRSSIPPCSGTGTSRSVSSSFSCTGCSTSPRRCSCRRCCRTSWAIPTP